MFLNTFDLKEWMVRHWVNETANNKLKDSNDIAMPSKARLPAVLKKGLEVLETFLDNLPKLESHYCRSSSKRLYLEPLFQTKTDVYRLYKDYCDTNSAKELSLVHFKKQMKIKNIYIFTNQRKTNAIFALAIRLKTFRRKIMKNTLKEKMKPDKKKK